MLEITVSQLQLKNWQIKLSNYQIQKVLSNSLLLKNQKENRSEILIRGPNIKKAEKLLDYVPKISLEEGILKVIKKQLNDN